EIILFAWVFGMDKGWKEITSHADIKVPGIFKFVIKWVTPGLLLFVFVGAFFKPVDNDWNAVFQGTWVLDDGSVINQILNTGLHKKIATTTDATQLVELNKQLTFVNWSRLLLVATFAGIAALVYVAYRKRVKEGRWA
ncbi:MAG: sodium:calcium symporter, partial [Saprospiraceae bacterium]